MPTIDPAALDRHFPQIQYETGLFMIDYLRRLNQEFENDITCAIVLGEIAQHSVRDLMKRDFPRSGLPSADFATVARVTGALKRCNALSVAESSGIPRETVRRKIDKLVARGMVTRDEKGTLALVPGIGSRFRTFDRRTVQDLVDLATRIRDLLERG